MIVYTLMKRYRRVLEKKNICSCIYFYKDRFFWIGFYHFGIRHDDYIYNEIAYRLALLINYMLD